MNKPFESVFMIALLVLALSNVDAEPASSQNPAYLSVERDSFLPAI